MWFAVGDTGEVSSEGSITGDLASFPWRFLAPDAGWSPPLCILVLVGLLVFDESSQGEGECGWTPFCRCAMSSEGGGG